jgi:probable F420-dependent oxidoreductase
MSTDAHPVPQLGRIGLWTFSLELQPMAKSQEAAQEIEELGFETVWLPEAVGREAFAHSALVLAATKKLKVATGIASIAARTAMSMQAGQKTLSEAFPGRFVLGMGVSHGHMVTKLHKSPYEKPYSTMIEYLDAMDSVPFMAAAPTTPTYRVLAALGPKMLKLSAERAAGAHPYFTTPEHTATAREILGGGPLLAPEQMVMFETDATKARETARKYMSTYTRLPNYANNLLRLGFTQDEITNQDDRLVDAIVCWGTLDTIAARIKEHHDAGADHVCVQVLPHDQKELPMSGWRELAQLLK